MAGRISISLFVYAGVSIFVTSLSSKYLFIPLTMSMNVDNKQMTLKAHFMIADKIRFLFSSRALVLSRRWVDLNFLTIPEFMALRYKMTA